MKDKVFHIEPAFVFYGKKKKVTTKFGEKDVINVGLSAKELPANLLRVMEAEASVKESIKYDKKYENYSFFASKFLKQGDVELSKGDKVAVDLKLNPSNGRVFINISAVELLSSQSAASASVSEEKAPAPAESASGAWG